MPEKILIVDDDIDSLKLIGLMLQRQGYEVAAANAGNQALPKALAEHPDLIILDVMMPDINGYEVCKRLRANPETKNIPIIMFTAKTLIDDKVIGFEAGADDYLTKPTHPSELASRVKAVLARSANTRRVEAPTSSRGMAIGVLGAKGGVGTTTIALNLTTAIAQSGKENPIVADFRLGMGTLGLYMGMGRSTGMTNVLSKPTAEIRPQLLETELVAHVAGFRALLSSSRPRDAMMNFSPDALSAVINGLRTLGRPVVFDLGSGFNPIVARVQREMDKLLVVIDPNGVTLAVARELIRELDANAPGRTNVVIVNRAQSSTQTPWQEVEQLLGQEIRAIISAAPELAFQAAEAGKPIILMQPNAIVTNQIMKLADLVAAPQGAGGSEMLA
ncbi:MAG: response regulator [Chloroflexi bacterium]|nr:response regulator [Chloroflexota bacterium]